MHLILSFYREIIEGENGSFIRCTEIQIGPHC